MNLLLDKMLVRYSLTGLRDVDRRELSPFELEALSFLSFGLREHTVLIGLSSFNTLQQSRDTELVKRFLGRVGVLRPGRYTVRWSRRIRETTRLTREDSQMIALATFGDFEEMIGTTHLVTLDQRLIHGFTQHHVTLEGRLRRMCADIGGSYAAVTLPIVAPPNQIMF